MVKRRIAIIPARGGSKRIPKKNITDFNGQPMIAWTIKAARESKLFDRILVSTDDSAIAEVSIRAGAEVPFLREDFADDYSTVSEATTFALQQAMEYWNEEYSVVVQLMANCPLRTSVDIQLLVAIFEAKKRTAQISCFEYGWMNPWWAATINDEGRPTQVFSETLTQRSQDLPKLYCPTGAIWISTVKALLAHQTFYSPDYTFEPISLKSAMDIDDYEDLEIANVLVVASKRSP
ncbi:acylneuraminate cytidylyltransferase family protein [Psychrobacter sp. DAB_AL32B]|uniref:acylneuraminate cytidylyltransferase family protein n=1 Tax=Psychrobacter sp. DAB_AL32B TaxID=1028414 RepID=UPI000B7E997C|nr:acylneuraminate cytidylyltransferase family protein [Psychrobacter sp. DAB_AL32B]OXL20545.1 acylneuraminate cytidylyltransferase [Psychrobacter sp. DAB_AL32B]